MGGPLCCISRVLLTTPKKSGTPKRLGTPRDTSELNGDKPGTGDATARPHDSIATQLLPLTRLLDVPHSLCITIYPKSHCITYSLHSYSPSYTLVHTTHRNSESTPIHNLFMGIFTVRQLQGSPH